MLYKYSKAMIPSPDGKTDSFDIVCGVLQENTFAPYMFIF